MSAHRATHLLHSSVHRQLLGRVLPRYLQASQVISDGFRLGRFHDIRSTGSSKSLLLSRTVIILPVKASSFQWLTAPGVSMEILLPETTGGQQLAIHVRVALSVASVPSLSRLTDNSLITWRYKHLLTPRSKHLLTWEYKGLTVPQLTTCQLWQRRALVRTDCSKSAGVLLPM